jgi:hypothetical protein
MTPAFSAVHNSTEAKIKDIYSNSAFVVPAIESSADLLVTGSSPNAAGHILTHGYAIICAVPFPSSTSNLPCREQHPWL